MKKLLLFGGVTGAAVIMLAGSVSADVTDNSNINGFGVYDDGGTTIVMATCDCATCAGGMDFQTLSALTLADAGVLLDLTVPGDPSALQLAYGAQELLIDDIIAPQEVGTQVVNLEDAGVLSPLVGQAVQAFEIEVADITETAPASGIMGLIELDAVTGVVAMHQLDGAYDDGSQFIQGAQDLTVANATDEIQGGLGSEAINGAMTWQLAMVGAVEQMVPGSHGGQAQWTSGTFAT